MVKSSNKMISYKNEENPLINKENPDKNDFLLKIQTTVRATVLSLLLSLSIPNATAWEVAYSDINLPSWWAEVTLSSWEKVILQKSNTGFIIKPNSSSLNWTDNFEWTIVIDWVVFRVVSNDVEKGGVSVYNDLLLQCDSNEDWVINTKADWKKWLVSKEVAKKEHKCELKYENAQLDKENAQLDKENAQLDKEVAKSRERTAQLDEDIERLKQEIIQRLSK